MTIEMNRVTVAELERMLTHGYWYPDVGMFSLSSRYLIIFSGVN
ncbi:MAG: hypothetical protein OEY64_03100 [Nitrospinota bacterium]|nr:hypothetical protein [Nitrospinota bacterium]